MEESSVTNTEIRRLVINNDSEAIIKILEDFGLHEDAVIEITTANHYLARLFLNFATACASNGSPSPEGLFCCQIEDLIHKKIPQR